MASTNMSRRSFITGTAAGAAAIAACGAASAVPAAQAAEAAEAAYPAWLGEPTASSRESSATRQKSVISKSPATAPNPTMPTVAQSAWSQERPTSSRTAEATAVASVVRLTRASACTRPDLRTRSAASAAREPATRNRASLQGGSSCGASPATPTPKTTYAQ